MTSAARASLAIAMTVSACFVLTRSAAAQHADLLFAQSPSGQLVTGAADFDNGVWTVGLRSFEGELPAVSLMDAPTGIYFEADPGFNARTQAELDADNPPPGSFLALPGLTNLSFDVVPISIGANAANLFFWDGAGAVDFQPAVGATLTISVGALSATADGTNTIVGGFAIQSTDAGGIIHRHPDYVLDDGIAGSYAPQGIYLLPLVAKMDGLANSDVLAITFAAGEIDEAAHEAALAWVEAHVVPEPAGLTLSLAAGALALATRSHRRWRRAA